MTTQLPERLRALAGEAPAALSAGDLWAAGRRRHRRRVVTSLTLAGCLVVAAALLGLGDWQSRRPEPAGPPPNVGPMAIPQRFFYPSPWLPSTSSPGRLVALFGATRDHFPFGSDLDARGGVSAGSQAYHFLDLPGMAPDYDVELSPDGRHVAYFVDGQPRGDARLGDRSIVGVAILDVTTGEVERHVVATEHGLFPSMLSWADDRTVALASDHLTSAAVESYSGRTVVRLFTLGRSEPVVLPHSNVLPVPVVTTTGYSGSVHPRVLRSYDVTGRVKGDVLMSTSLVNAAYDAASGRLAGIRGDPTQGGSGPGRLMVGRAADGRARLSVVPGGHRFYAVLGWSDAHHVVTDQGRPTSRVLLNVDVRTGAERRLTWTGYQTPGSHWYGVTLASGALHHPATVTAIEPPQPWNPRWVAAVATALLLLGSGCVVLVLRSRRARR